MKIFFRLAVVIVILAAAVSLGVTVKYRLEAHLGYLKYLAEQQAKNRTVTFREGLTRQEMARQLKQAGFVYADEFLTLTEHDEGKLFPDTYNLTIDMPATDIRQKLLDNFTLRTKALQPTTEQIILASIVEREAKGDADRADIAGVYFNRVNAGMKLEADPTVQYAKYTVLGLAPTKNGELDYWAPITQADYTSVDSAYNTYEHVGLPPGPICNPGLKSLTAAVDPAKTDAVYFFHTKDGQAVFSKTLNEHLTKLQSSR